MSLVHSLFPLLLDHYSHLLKISTPPTSSLFSAPDLSSHFTDTMTSLRKEPPQTPPKLLYTPGICPQVLFSHQLPSVNLPCSQLEPFLPFVHRTLPLSTTRGHCPCYVLPISALVSSLPPSLPGSYSLLHQSPCSCSKTSGTRLPQSLYFVFVSSKALLTGNHVHST